MSRSERKEEDVLLVCCITTPLKARLLVRVTVVRDGMSINKDRVMRNTLQNDGCSKEECPTVITIINE